MMTGDRESLAAPKNQSHVAAPATRKILNKIEQFGFDAMFAQIRSLFSVVLIRFCFKLNDRT